ncbi:MAG: hypothetical protein ACHQZR_00390 [Candidatus Limnocylindrales bacterium]
MRTVPLPIPDDTLERLRDLARAERRSPAAQALVLIERGLRRRPTGQPASLLSAVGERSREGSR